MFGFTESQIAKFGMTFGVGGFILYMLFIVWNLAKESKAGKQERWFCFCSWFGNVGIHREECYRKSTRYLEFNVPYDRNSIQLFSVCRVYHWFTRRCACAGMCGGIVTALGMFDQRLKVTSSKAPLKSGEVVLTTPATSLNTSPSMLFNVSMYNLGRISTYTLIGAFAGILGSAAWLMSAFSLFSKRLIL